MAAATFEAKQLAHEWIDQLGPAQIKAVVGLLEVMVDDDEDELTEEDRIAIQAGLDYFAKGGKGIPFGTGRRRLRLHNGPDSRHQP